MISHEILKKYFGYDEFRGGQDEIINAVVEGRDVMGVMPTGAGKSLCYQIPALIMQGVTIVVSPLISLMRDQVQALVANGVAAAFINSSLTDAQTARAISNARNGMYKIIYIAPERLLTDSMLALVLELQIALVAVDEAHCTSQWGNDFRPSYLDISTFVEMLPNRPVLAAFTATATPRVREDIVKTLGLRNPISVTTGFDRPNLYFGVKHARDKFSALMQCLNEHDESGIIYCATRKEVENVTERLDEEGFSVARYHAGLSDAERSQSQDNFLHDRVEIIVATNAFGMGIDKPNVRFVVHYNMPQNVESYYQEAGRAGRDGLPASCILLYARKDINTALFLINKSENPAEVARNKHLLSKIEQFCETDECLRSCILKYFGETPNENCGNCGNCNGNFHETDVTLDAKKVLSHITRLNKAGKKFMFTATADILIGKADFFTDLPTFGLMKGSNRQYIRQLTNRLTTLGYIHDDGKLSVTEKAREVLFGDTAVYVRGEKRDSGKSEKSSKKKNKAPTFAISDELFGELKALRLEIAQEEKVPAFVIFSDATLVDMCQKHPLSLNEMLDVSGVGEVKRERYGERFLQILQRTNRNNAFAAPEKLTPKLFMQKVTIDDEPIQISRVADNCNAVLIQHGLQKTSGAKLNALLIEAGYLENCENSKIPTEKGRAAGIVTVPRNSEHGSYEQSLFGSTAQRLCVEMISI
ncbi:MAG: DNA helicase RecQ [Defluviitaleaceae bacterium]|nr:DNA helicase RecQ [Defluviitaleaceae bacterium]MCL2262845.1 DNA helicase RecQ [Defluviitaleaceae bacterium]